MRSTAPLALIPGLLLLAGAPMPAPAQTRVGGQAVPARSLSPSNANSAQDAVQAQQEEVASLVQQVASLVAELQALKASKPQPPASDASDAAKAAYQQALAAYQTKLEALSAKLAAAQKKVQEAQAKLARLQGTDLPAVQRKDASELQRQLAMQKQRLDAATADVSRAKAEAGPRQGASSARMPVRRPPSASGLPAR
jgi:chromosome segregation ATPase